MVASKWHPGFPTLSSAAAPVHFERVLGKRAKRALSHAPLAPDTETMAERPVFVFDLDGVLIDSLPVLYDAYARFVRGLGSVPDAAEFDRLNGPTVDGIVDELARAHGATEDRAILRSRYDALLDDCYERARAVPGALETLRALRGAHADLALVTSASSARASTVLQRLGLRELFQHVVTGDEVTHSKPAPEIYLRLGERYPGRSCWAVEDSRNGVAAAVAAGMQVVFFAPVGEALPKGASRHATAMGQVYDILLGELFGSEHVARYDRLEVQIVRHQPELEPATRRRIGEIWKRSQRLNPALFDGPVLSYLAHQQRGGELLIQCFRTTYRFLMAKLELPELPVWPLGVSAITFDQQGRVLMGQRRGVTEYDGYFELVPSGGINEEHSAGDRADVVGQLLQELAEETTLPVDDVAEVRPFVLLRDRDHGVYDIGCTIEVGPRSNFSTSVLAAEYGEQMALPLEQMRDRAAHLQIVPASGALLHMADRP